MLMGRLPPAAMSRAATLAPLAMTRPRHGFGHAGGREAGLGSGAMPGGGSGSLGQVLSGAMTFGPRNYIDVTSPWARALSMAAHVAPLPYGAVLGAANLAMRGYNTLNANAIRKSLGLAPLDLGQTIGAVLGLNDYALGGSNTLVSRSDAAAPAVHPVTGTPIGISTGGLFDEGSWGPFGLFGTEDLHTYMTPQELNARQIIARARALRGGHGGTPRTTTPVREAKTGLLSGAYKQAAHYGNDRGGGGVGNRGFGPSGERGPGGMLSGADKKSAHY